MFCVVKQGICLTDMSVADFPPPEQRDWRRAAACRDQDPELFFPTHGDGEAFKAQVRKAKRVCAGCPVWRQCLREALVRIPEGVAGGLTKRERKALMRRISSGSGVAPRSVRAVAHPSPAGPAGEQTGSESA